MNFILSKIISRPKSVVLSADEQRMDNNELKSTALSTSSPSSPLVSIAGDSTNCDQNNEIQTSSKSVVKKCLVPTDNNLATTTITSETVPEFVADSSNEKEINGDESINVASEKGITDEILKNTDRDKLLKEKENHTVNNKILNVAENEHVQSTNVLPDIINVQPIKEPEKSNDSLVTLLSNNLNGLDLNLSQGVGCLNVPTSNYDGGISSDDEYYAECQTFTESTQNLDNSINPTNITTNPVNNENDSKQQWDTILSNVESSNNDENLQESTLELCSPDGYQSDNQTMQENEYVSASNLTINVSKLIAPIETINQELKAETHDHIITSADLNVDRSEANLSDPSQVSEKLNKQNEILNNTKPLENSFDLKQGVDGENFDDSIENMYIPQVLLRQTEKKKEEAPHEVSTTHSNSCSLKSRELSPTSKTETSLDSNSINLPKDKDIIKYSDEDAENVPEMKLSSNSLNEYLNQPTNIVSPSQQQHVISTSTALNQTVDVSQNVEAHSNEIVESNDVSTSKVLNQTFDNFELANAISSNPVRPAESLANITFAASSEAINSTVNLSLHRCKSNASLNASFNDVETSFNRNETIPIDDLDESRKFLPKSTEAVEDEAKVTSTNNNCKEMGNNNRSLSTTDSFKESLNSSVEPMEIDMSPQKETRSPEVEKSVTEKENEIEEESGSRDNVEFSIEQFNTNSKLDFEFKAPMMPPLFFGTSQLPSSKRNSQGFTTDDDFKDNAGLIFSAADFDYLLSKGSNNISLSQRDSLLLRFDPLLGHAVPVNQQQQQQDKNILAAAFSSSRKLGGTHLSSTTEENDEEQQELSQIGVVSNNNNSSLLIQNEYQNDLNSTIPIATNTSSISSSIQAEKLTSLICPNKNNKFSNFSQDTKGDDKMSVDVIQDIKIANNDVNKTIDNLREQSEEKKDYKMEDLEKKIKNEVLETEDVEKKLKDAEQREEILLKRITEKDKIIAKMSGVIEAYEKAVAESIAEKEQIKQNYESQIAELKADRDSNYQHLLSLESTFSDLHVKYERSKQTAEKLRKSEEDLLSEKKQTVENLRLQEQRYEKMKNHAFQQLEIANNKLETLSKNHSAEITKLKALLKKEEISKLSIAEQLQQKARENEELMKICDELINGQGS